MAHESSKLVIYAALAGNALIAVTKFAAAGYTGSAAMLSEAVHSTVDTGNELLLLWGLHRAARPPSRAHPFGHGLQLYFWCFVVAVLIFGVGGGVSVLEGLEKIRQPHPVENAWVNYLVLVASLVFEAFSWTIALREFNRARGGRPWLSAIRLSKDPTVFTVLFEDTAALIGLLIALAGVVLSQMLGLPVLDGVASLVIGLVLCGTAAILAYESQSLLTGEGVAPAVRDSIERIITSEPGVLRPNEILTMHFGPADVLVALSLDYDDAFAAGQVEQATANIERRVKAAHPEVTRVFVEVQGSEAHRANTPLGGDVAG